MAAVEPQLTLRGDSRVRRRRLVNRLAEGGMMLAAFIAIGLLGIVVWSIAKRGAGELSWGFLTKDLPIPFSPALEDLTIPNAKGLYELAKNLCNRS